MSKEIQALKDLSCLEGVDRSNNVKVLQSKLVLRRKCNHRGNIEKCNVRLVVCGNEKEEIDWDSFSPVVDYTIIKLLLGLVVQKKYKIGYFNFQNAFSNGVLNRPFFAELPKQMFGTGKSRSTVRKLQRSYMD